MNKVDVLILIVVGVPALLGLKSGFLKNLFAFAGILLGLFLAVRFYEPLAKIFSALPFLEKFSNVAAFLGIIIFFYFLGVYIANKISGMNFVTSTADKIAGMAFGILQGLIIASLAMLFITTFDFIPREIVNESKFYPLVSEFAPKAFNIISGLFPSVKTFFEEMHLLKNP